MSDQVNVTPRERNEPTNDELVEMLELLVGAADEGLLKGVVFMLQAPTGEHIVDYRGSHELVELACRTVRGRIADEIQSTDPEIAARIRDTNAAVVAVKH